MPWGMSSPSSVQVPTVTLDGDVQIPQLGFGVWQVPPKETYQAVAEALRVGYRHIDTAAAYGNEAGVGQAIHSSGLDRGDVFVTTKCFNDHHGHAQATAAFKASLEQLALDYVDLYLIHWPVPSQDLYVETWKAFVELREEGLIRAIGVSNFNPEHLQRLVAETGVAPAINQVELHPYFQQTGLRREHEDLGIATEAWSPLAQGRIFEDEALQAIAERHDRSVSQVVVRWHLQLGNVVIPKSVTPSRIADNFDVFSFHLTEADMDELAALDAGTRLGPDPETFVRP
jgi:2,5-diketo-D-gluconate reductase A